jgi:hypothetical protein
MQNSKQHVCKMSVHQLPTRVSFGVAEWQMGGVELRQTAWLLRFILQYLACKMPGDISVYYHCSW